MKAVENDEEYELYFKVKPTGEEIKKSYKGKRFIYETCKK